jgi:hypothetical protein
LAAQSFRSLPLRFVLHAALPVARGGLGATRVCFLLPARCAKPAFARAVAAGLLSHGNNCTESGPREDADSTAAVAAGAAYEPREQEAAASGGALKGGAGGADDGGLAAAGWALQCRPCPELRFSFRGRLVPQPSVVWVLTRLGR